MERCPLLPSYRKLTPGNSEAVNSIWILLIYPFNVNLFRERKIIVSYLAEIAVESFHCFRSGGFHIILAIDDNVLEAWMNI